MQACEVCGLDTSESARVCACGRDHAGGTNDDTATALTPMVEQARATRTAATPSDTERGRDVAAGRVAAPRGRRTPSGMQPSDVRERIALREVEPGDNDRFTPRPEPSTIAASLVEAFERRQPVDPPQPREMGSTDVPSGGVSTIASDGTADGRAPSVTSTSLPHDAKATQTNTLEEATQDGPNRTATQGTSPRSFGADGPGPAAEITGRFANIPTVPLTPAGDSAPDGAAPAAGDGVAPHTTDDVGTEAAATDTTDDAGAEPDTTDHTSLRPAAPATDDDPHDTRATAVDAGAQPDTTDHTAPDGAHDQGVRDARAKATTADDDDHGAAAHGTRSAEARTAGVTDEEDETDPWTAIAQVMLLIVGMLCVFQVAVLLVLHQFLLQELARAGSPSPDVGNVLSAYDKVVTVLLPALAGGAFAAATFAAWRAMTTPTRGRRVLGLPVALWGVVAGAAAVLTVILLDASSTVTQAHRVTQLAIAACTALGVASIASPRSLADPSIDPVADAERGPTA